MDMILNDHYRETGADYEVFKSKVSDMVGITKDITVRGGDVELLSYCDIPEVQEEGKLKFYVLSDSYIQDFLSGKRLVIGGVPKDAFPEELIEEMIATTGLVAVIGNEKYLVSDLAIPTLSLRASVSGDKTINRQNLIRNLHFADAIISKNDTIHFVYREVDGVKKIFAALGSQYSYIPQSVITDAADIIMVEEKVGKAEVCRYEIDHDFTTITLSLPELSEAVKDDYSLPHAITPGIYLATSDTGSSSITARSVYYSGRGMVILDEVMIKHVGKITGEMIVEKVNESLLANIRLLPETLSELIGMPIMDYSKVDLSTERGARKNMEKMSSILSKSMSKYLKGAMAKKTQKEILTCLMDELNSNVQYTLYDIAILFLELSARIEGVNAQTLYDIQKACAVVPFKLKKDMTSITSSKTEEDDEEAYLIPA